MRINKQSMNEYLKQLYELFNELTHEAIHELVNNNLLP